MRFKLMEAILFQPDPTEFPLSATRIHRLPRELFTAEAEQLIARATSLAPGVNRAPQPPAKDVTADQITTQPAGLIAEGGSAAGASADPAMEMHTPTVRASPIRIAIGGQLKADPCELHVIMVWARVSAVATEQGLGFDQIINRFAPLFFGKLQKKSGDVRAAALQGINIDGSFLRWPRARGVAVVIGIDPKPGSRSLQLSHIKGFLRQQLRCRQRYRKGQSRGLNRKVALVKHHISQSFQDPPTHHVASRSAEIILCEPSTRWITPAVSLAIRVALKQLPPAQAT